MQAEDSKKKLDTNLHQLEMFDLETKRIEQDVQNTDYYLNKV